ncbi:MAG: penicillin-binding protein activator [Nevskia sp.]|jgi:hypothetical protein|nr:penicillin-binding protein activator [Nevskia sp.]
MLPYLLGRTMLARRNPWHAPALAGLFISALTACATSAGVATRFPGGTTPVSAPAVLAAPVSGRPTLADAEAAVRRGDLLGAAALYQDAADNVPPSVATEYRLRAADLADAAAAPERADVILDQIAATALNPTQQTRYRLLRAGTALARHDPQRALRLLPNDDLSADPVAAERQLRIRGVALFGIGDAVGGTQALVLRERFLATPRAIADNRELLWSELNSVPLTPATVNLAAHNASPVRGWLELAQLAQRNAALQDYDAWRRRFPRHPGEERLANLFLPALPTPPALPAQQTVATTPAPSTASTSTVPPPPSPTTPAARVEIPIAGPASTPFNELAAHGQAAGLLLPQSGALLPAGDAVKAGYTSAAAAGNATDTRVYDGASGNVVDAYQNAVRDGAAFAIGPLLKEGVTQLAASGQSRALSTPVLALNYLDSTAAVPAGFYQFGLAPEDEAQAAAEDAVARGLTRVLVLASANDWGNRVSMAFEQRLRELGGRVVEASRYSGEPASWADPVRKLLRFVAIDDKKKAADARAKAQPGIDPQRRNDFDFVFIAARASQARVLWPLFRYFHADRVPVYATSAVFEGSGDSDLSGIRFCDAPWVFDGDGHWTVLRADAQNGRSFDNARLYALGSDAFTLADLIAKNQLHPGDNLSGATGTLRVDASGAIHRGLLCGQMTRAAPFLLAPPESANGR